MPNYQQSKLYKIESDLTHEKYFGGTTQTLSRRLAKHRDDIKKGSGISSKEILQYPDARIVLLENFPCNNKDELRAREQFWIDQNKDIAVNKLRAFRTEEEKKDQIKEYEQSEKRKEYQKKYHKNYEQSEKRKEYHKNYEQSEKYKEYNLERSKKIIKCECGKIYKGLTNKSRHEKTKFHQEYILKQT